MKKVPKSFRGGKTRSPFQQLYFCFLDAQTVAPLKTFFQPSSVFSLAIILEIYKILI